MTAEDPATTIRAYYEALGDGKPLFPYFAADPDIVKFGITERLTGSEEVTEGLRTQTETTTDWTVESHALVVGERDTDAWFGDEVRMAWTDVTTDERHDYETRWSGALKHHDETTAGDERDPGAWRFVCMHVSQSGTL